MHQQSYNLSNEDYSSGGKLDRKATTGPEGRNRGVNAMKDTNGPSIIYFDDKDMVGLGERVRQ
jgi:hypothetical protein